MADSISHEGPEALSSALAVNLAETRRHVEIPSEYLVLLEAVDRYYGVRRTAHRLLTEVFHPLRNLGEVATHMHSVCCSHLHYYERSPERTRCLGLIASLLEQLYLAEPDETVVHSLVGTQIELITSLTRSRFRSELAPVLDELLAILRSVQERRPLAFLSYSILIRRAGQQLAPGDPVAAGLAEVYRGVVEPALELFDQGLDLEAWCRAQRSGPARECATAVARPLRQAVEQCRARLEQAVTPPEVLATPGIDDLLSLALSHALQVESLVQRIALYIYLAGVPELQHRNMEVLRNLYFAIKKVCSKDDKEEILRAVDLITDYLGECEPRSRFLLYKCLEKLGAGIANLDSHAITVHFVERAIATGFEAPSIRGVSEEWEVHVNPNHLLCLRSWLAIIENNPITFDQLLSALVINLYFSGVFVADTDLFQRDISSLLNADIADAFNLIMQLVTFFPVFFNEVGSEGELREISTRLDQITHRQDPVIHYLRKQSHAESNNRLIGFARAVYAYWRTGEAATLDGYLPPSICGQLRPEHQWYAGIHALTAELETRFGLTESSLPTVDLDALRSHLDTVIAAPAAAQTDHVAIDAERVLLLIRLSRLLKAKYSFSADLLLPMLEDTRLVSLEARTRLRHACDHGEHLEIVHAGNLVLLELKQRIIDPEPTEAFENIYMKRHIAAGIPSMYGTYREPKFDSMGMMIRLMRFLEPHLEQNVASFNYAYMTRESIRTAHEIIQQMLLGLRVAGLRVHHLSTKLDILRRGIAQGTLSASQYLNIFDFMSEALSDVIQTNYIALHNLNLERMAPRLARERGEPGEADHQAATRVSEQFFRAIIASTYAIQPLDLFLRQIRQTLRSMTETLSDQASGAVLNYMPYRLISFLDDPLEDHEDQLYLGYKGFLLKKLRSLSLPVPSGFVISTELFNVQQAMAYPALEADTRKRVVEAVRRLESSTGRMLGDISRPLLLSVRSGSAFSMPGMMVTILNVGISLRLAESVPLDQRLAWGAWDSYRRYLQNVAMSLGVDRDLFDDVMLRHKERIGITKKSEFTAAQMRLMALEYRDISLDRGVELFEEPVDQLMQAILLVLGSWGSESARLYRKQLGLSDDWGTGVIVQRMVFGNIDSGSGSGVTFTRDPRASTTAIGLFGDFTMRSQGEDVVGGLVRPYPVSEKQRHEYTPNLELSLETRFPAIFSRLKEIAGLLINDHGFEHQEIEFTFESDDPADLHLLQIRPMRFLTQHQVEVFARPAELEASQLGSGIGVSGGALSGLVAFTDDDVCTLRASHPDRHLILIRPDTVPEDIHLVLSVDGLLTARGGFTSHAAVTAKRLGKCCVVNCNDLVVSESNRSARLGSHLLSPGDAISIDGLLGPVYAGEHEITTSSPPLRMP